MADTHDKPGLKCPVGHQTIIFSGNSRFPENVSAKHVSGFLTVEVEVDLADMKILAVSCTLVPSSLGEKLLSDLLVGRCIGDGVKDVVQEIDARLFSSTKKAIIAALEDLYRKYLEYVKEQKN